MLLLAVLMGCKTAPVTPQHTAVYESNIQVLAMPSCTAKMEASWPCYAILADSEGRKFIIGSPGASEDVQKFIESLKAGEIYFLPCAFEGFLKKRIPDYTKNEPSTCEVHHSAMTKRVVPMAHGMIPLNLAEDEQGAWQRRTSQYPHPGDCHPANDIVMPGELERVMVFVCSACERAKRQAEAKQP